MSKTFIHCFILLGGIAGLYSCQNSRQLPYFKDLNDTTAVSKVATSAYQPLRLQPNDEIQVTISSSSPEASHFFNLLATSQPMQASTVSVSSPSQGFNNLYHVSFGGRISMPVLGEIKVEGMTTEEVKADILQRLKDYLKDPVVIVTLTNFKVTVIGEVNKPVVIPVNGQTINVLEAVGASGDLTVFGIRKNVKVIRKLPDGNTEVAILDLNNSRVMQSPYFQLRQNDIVYVQPNKNKGIQGTKANIWVPVVTALVSVAAIIITAD
ncbi:MAG: polysaccharide biosynthesis/export family protein [Chitinophagales bacterium]